MSSGQTGQLEAGLAPLRAARGVWFPKFGNTQMHVAGSYQNRSNQKSALNGAYAARPFTRHWLRPEAERMRVRPSSARG